jgi:hypothetical protein
MADAREGKKLMALDKTGLALPEAARFDQSAQIDKRSAGQHWMRELEAARGDALSKTQAVQGRTAPAEQAQGAQLARAGNIASPSGQSAASANPESRLPPSQGGESLRDVPASLSRIANATQLKAAIAGGATGNAAVRSIETALAQALSANHAHALPGERIRWRVANLHVQHVDEGVVVWLRDADIRDEELKQLRGRIEEQVEKLGLRLHQFHLNGEMIYGDASPRRGEQS